MVVVRYYDKNGEVLSQLRDAVPAPGDEIVVKGRKGKVVSVKDTEKESVRVDVELEVIKKVVVGLDPKKKR